MQKVLLAELPAFVREVLKSLDSARDKSRATLVALRGDLGAGKTTFVQALAKELGIEETVQSPTYVLMKRFDISNHPRFKRLIHIDLYRLERPEEFGALKPEEFLHDPHNLICIEWPERAEALLPTPDLMLTFSSEGAGAGERFIEIV
jgi:tRNA threonylcarbamoyladenosine biosynthesis protein TsaE